MKNYLATCATKIRWCVDAKSSPIRFASAKTSAPCTSTSVACNVDDFGFYNQTDWIGATDAFLVLDQDIDGLIDRGNELFANPSVALGAQGGAALRWMDANRAGDSADFRECDRLKRQYRCESLRHVGRRVRLGGGFKRRGARTVVWLTGVEGKIVLRMSDAANML